MKAFGKVHKYGDNVDVYRRLTLDNIKNISSNYVASPVLYHFKKRILIK